MDSLLDAGFVALQSAQAQDHDALVRELRTADNSIARRLAAAIEIRRFVVLGHSHACEELLPELANVAPGDPPVEIADWLSNNVRGILCDDGKNPEQALDWFDRAANRAESAGLLRKPWRLGCSTTPL